MKSTTKHYTIFSAIIFIGLAIGCGTHKINLKSEPLTDKDEKSKSSLSDYHIQPGDQLEIKFFYNPELNESVTVRPDGKICLQLVEEINAAGLKPVQLDKILTDVYGKELAKPELTIIVKSFSSQQVFVGGEVNSPSAIPLTPGMTAIQAIINAGGFSETAKMENVIIIRKDATGSSVSIPVNMKEPPQKNGSGTSFPLMPNDVVYVPRTWF